MPFESISSSTSQKETSAWAMRMIERGYGAAFRMERAIRVVRDCRTIKDTLKIADRFLVAYHDLAFAASDAEAHGEPEYIQGTRTGLDGFVTQLRVQFPRCVAMYTDARKAVLAKAKGGKRQLAIAAKSLDTLRQYEGRANWRDKPDECQHSVDAAIAYWVDQTALLEQDARA